MTFLGRIMIPLLLLSLPSLSSAQNSRWVDSTLASLSLEEKVGQLFVAEFVGLYTHEDHPAYQYALEMIHRYHVGSFILAGGNVLDIPMITNKLQRISRVPLLINADFEGGMTYMHPWRLNRGWSERLPRYVAGGGTQFPSQMAIGATGNPRYAYEFGRITALEARAIGIHWTNSPVADVNNNADNPIINTRSYGEDPHAVAAMVEAYVRGAQDAGVIATLKHFPGHGDTREDTHMGLPSLPFDAARLDTMELIPFKAGITAGAGAVMTAHIALPKIDPSGRPSTLSQPIITGILRNKLGFQGLVVTDGMRMQGITDKFSASEAAVAVIEAGGDLILGSADIDSAYNSVLNAVRSGRISSARLDSSVRRILSAKEHVGLAKSRTIDVDSIFTRVGKPEFQKLAAEISDASVVLLRNQDGVLPLNKDTRLHIVAVTEDPGWVIGTDLLNEAVSQFASVTLTRVSNETGKERFAEITSSLKDADALLLGVYLSIGAWKGEHQFSRQLEEFLGSLSHLAKPVILVAFGDPYILGKLPETAAVVTPMNGTLLAEISVARAVAGKIEMKAKLPVTIPGRYARGSGLKLKPRI
jgi:beta-N-acetylhexosaminidase